MTKHASFHSCPHSSYSLLRCWPVVMTGRYPAHAGEPQVTVHVVETAPLAVTTELPGRTSAFRIAEVRPGERDRA